MNVDATLQADLLERFAPLNAAGFRWPKPATLSETLNRLVPKDGVGDRNVQTDVASQFCTAAIDIWLRGVHSFLVSVALTEGSPVWASVSGYYASHYAVRGLAHLEGIFQLFQKKRIVQLNHRNGRFTCTFIKKNAGDGEHQVYWKLLKQKPDFKGNDLFTENKIGTDCDASDIRHRSYANYTDHLFPYAVFGSAEKEALRERIEGISKIAFDTPPIPRVSQFADLEYVQVIAYHRIVWFRALLDEVLVGNNAFWNEHRNPHFAEGLMDFQLVDNSGSILGTP